MKSRNSFLKVSLGSGKFVRLMPRLDGHGSWETQEMLTAPRLAAKKLLKSKSNREVVMADDVDRREVR